MLPKRGPRAPEPGLVKRLDLRERGWARMGRAPRKGRGMEEVGEKRVCRGSGAEGWSSGASRSKNKRRKSNGKEDNVKSEEKRNESSGEGLIPLNSWAQLLAERGGDPRGSEGSGAQAQAVVWRAETFRLHPTLEQEEFLWRVGDATARLINMENFKRRKRFFEGKGIDCSWKSAWERRETEYAEIYKLLGSVNFHEACRFISEMWRSFTELLKAKKKGKLEPWQIVHPPGYRKREGQRLPVIYVRFDNYEVDLERRTLLLKFWNIELRFSGKARWLLKPGAEQGRLIIVYDEVKKRWYAKIAVKVTLQIERNPKSTLKAGVDLGREILAAVAVEDGHALLYRGGVLKSDYFYFERRIAAIDRMLSDPKLEEMDRSVLKEERRRLYDKRGRRREQIFANTAAHLAKMLKALSVGVVFVGYPRNIAQEKPGKGNTNMWGYRELITRVSVTLENHGIAVFMVPEDGTSRLCARHGCEVVRKPRGLVKCEKGHTMHSDVNAALNILLRGASALRCKVKVPERVKVHSFTPTPNRVIEKDKKP